MDYQYQIGASGIAYSSGILNVNTYNPDIYLDGESLRETLKTLRAKIVEQQDVIVKCDYCGQWGAVKTQCRYCGKAIG